MLNLARSLGVVVLRILGLLSWRRVVFFFSALFAGATAGDVLGARSIPCDRTHTCVPSFYLGDVCLGPLGYLNGTTGTFDLISRHVADIAR